MAEKRVNRKLVVQASTVFVTVSICTAVLLSLQPWQKKPEISARASIVAASKHDTPTQRVTVSNSGHASASASKSAPETSSKAPKTPPSTDTAQKTAAKAPAVSLASMASKSDPIAKKLDELPSSGKAAAKSADSKRDPEYTSAMPASASGERPKKMSEKEGDEALKPLLSHSVSDSDLSALKNLYKYVRKDKYNDARTYLKRIDDPIAKKLGLWLYYRAGATDTKAEDIAAFRTNNPLWPSRSTLAERAEEALFWREEKPKRILAYFAKKQPVSGAGWAALGRALIDSKRVKEGRPHLRKAWGRYTLTPSMEKRIKEKYASHLRAQDHKARVDYLLAQNSKKYLPSVERLQSLVPKKWKASVEARIAAVKRYKSAWKKLSDLPAKVKADPGVVLARIREARRKGKDSEAWSLLRSSPTEVEKLIDPDEWWEEREDEIRAALNAGHPKTAYAIAKKHGGETDPDDLNDAEFLAGWIALRFLKHPKTARKHFKAAAAAGGLPARRARASYWLGRTELVLGRKTVATAHFAEGAQHNYTFYGQLAHQMLEAKAAKHRLRTYVRPTEPEIKAFNKQDSMQAAVIASKAKLHGVVATFMFEFARHIESAPDMVLTAELASRIALRHIAVRMAKVAMNRSFPMEYYAYPDALPDFKALTKDQDLELALLCALTRQESEFNPKTESHAGAVGLMQLLPSTAREVARRLSVKYSKSKLKSDPAYNVSIGSAFLQRLVRNYDGSYMMALAGYNAGPGRVRQWVKQFGDPRKKKVDPIDWIERIPFTETRRYVHKIMESVQVYRSRLKKKRTQLRLAQDLHRGRSDKPRFMLQR